MAKITKEELIKIAKISQLRLTEDEIGPFVKQVQDVLTYAERVGEVAQRVEFSSGKNVNVLREDVIVGNDPKPILALAPEREEDYFVVPRIIENK